MTTKQGGYAGVLGVTDKSQDHSEHFKKLEGALNKAGIDHSLGHNPKTNVITVYKIVVPKKERGNGLGTAAMEAITSHADRHGKRVELSPSTDFGATSKDRLVRFYKRHGFVENKGQNKDFSTSETMYREPR